jgi:hypothetical protein
MLSQAVTGFCGFAALMCGKALLLRIAIDINNEAPLPFLGTEAEPQKLFLGHRKGKAFPHIDGQSPSLAFNRSSH